MQLTAITCPRQIDKALRGFESRDGNIGPANPQEGSFGRGGGPDLQKEGILPRLREQAGRSGTVSVSGGLFGREECIIMAVVPSGARS